MSLCDSYNNDTDVYMLYITFLKQCHDQSLEFSSLFLLLLGTLFCYPLFFISGATMLTAMLTRQGLRCYQVHHQLHQLGNSYSCNKQRLATLPEFSITSCACAVHNDDVGDHDDDITLRNG